MGKIAESIVQRSICKQLKNNIFLVRFGFFNYLSHKKCIFGAAVFPSKPLLRSAPKTKKKPNLQNLFLDFGNEKINFSLIDSQTKNKRNK